MADKPHPLMEIWRRQNVNRDGPPSQLLEALEGARRFFESEPMRELREQMQRLQDTPRYREMREHMQRLNKRRLEPQLLAERMLGRQEPAKGKLKRRSRGGRHRSFTPEQSAEAIRILRSHGPMTLDAACATLAEAGIKGKRTAVYELIWRPAYRSV